MKVLPKSITTPLRVPIMKTLKLHSKATPVLGEIGFSSLVARITDKIQKKAFWIMLVSIPRAQAEYVPLYFLIKKCLVDIKIAEITPHRRARNPAVVLLRSILSSTTPPFEPFTAKARVTTHPMICRIPTI
jgi:hypothetical protein